VTDCHGSDPTRAFELVALEPRPVARQGARDNAGHVGQPVPARASQRADDNGNTDSLVLATVIRSAFR